MLTSICAVILGIIGGPEIIIIAIVVLVLFGGRKIPELMRGIGGGVKEFKDASKDTTNSFKNASDTLKKERDEIIKHVKKSTEHI
jgi:sec-independent protein translocase protein TatA